MKIPNTKLDCVVGHGNRYIKSSDIVQLLKDDLIEILSNPSEEISSVDYLKERISTWENNIEIWRKKDGN